jgi:hypothetical protein
MQRKYRSVPAEGPSVEQINKGLKEASYRLLQGDETAKEDMQRLQAQYRRRLLQNLPPVRRRKLR